MVPRARFLVGPGVPGAPRIARPEILPVSAPCRFSYRRTPRQRLCEQEVTDGSLVPPVRRVGCPLSVRERVRAHRCGSEGHDRAPGVCDYDGGSARTGGLADRGGLHARGDGGDRRVLEAGVARPRRRRVVHAGARQRAAHPERSGPQERPERRGLDRRPVGARADSGQLRAAGPDPGTARPDADPQATGPRDHAAHATPAEDARRREREVDARGHRHPGRQPAGRSWRRSSPGRPIPSGWPIAPPGA